VISASFSPSACPAKSMPSSHKKPIGLAVISRQLSTIEITANDELFHHNKPILSGVDTRSMYCYLLAAEDHRDEETWAIHLWDAQAKGLNPQRTIGDDGKGLVSGHKHVFPTTSYDYDNFHLSRSLMDLRRYYRNRLKSAITALTGHQRKSGNAEGNIELADDLCSSKKKVDGIRHISSTLDTLISWLEHDILNKAGPTPEDRRELYNFVVEQLRKLECMESHRIRPVRITLENKRDLVLAFADVLSAKFTLIAQQFSIPLDTVWAICKLQRCRHNGDEYFFRSESLQRDLGERFDEVEDAILIAMDTTERTSSTIENTNGRVRRHIQNRGEIGLGYLDLLRFFSESQTFCAQCKTGSTRENPCRNIIGEIPPALARAVGLRALQAHRLTSILISFHQTLMQFRQRWVKTRQLEPKIPVY